MGKDIVKFNALIEACYQPASLWQMRLLPAALMQVKAGDKLSYKKDIEYQTISDNEVIVNEYRS